jgi:hypothetical protein
MAMYGSRFRYVKRKSVVPLRSETGHVTPDKQLSVKENTRFPSREGQENNDEWGEHPSHRGRLWCWECR